MSKIYAFLIESDVPARYMKNLMDFIYQKFLKDQKSFTEISRANVEENPSLTFTLLDKSGNLKAISQLIGKKPLSLNIKWLDEKVEEEVVNAIRIDISILVNSFKEEVVKGSLFFAWREGEEIVPEKIKGSENKPLNRIFLETQVLFFIILIIFSIFLFQVLGWLTPIALLAFQLVFVLFSNKIIARSADWKINEKNPFIHILEFNLPLGEHPIKDKFSKERLSELKNKVYEQIISKKGEIECQAIAQIFGESGVVCEPEVFKAKKVNVYNLVKDTATKYNFPMPEIVISNTVIPNAAASGPSPSRGVVLITTGLLTQLENNEIISVLGHEFGHLKGRDPLVLYGLTAIQYLLFFYVLYPILAFSIFLFFIYYWFILSLIYFIAKFFEARADLLSAIIVGQPDILARALEKIGMKRLLYEQIPSFRFQEWIGFDPHPPIYFRVNRLRNIKTPVMIRHPLIQSAKDVTRGFLNSLK